MTVEHPTAQDYANKYQRDADYWRELVERMIYDADVEAANAEAIAALAQHNGGMLA